MLPATNLQPLADRLAQALDSESVLSAFRLQVQLTCADSGRPQAGSPSASAGPVRIGIWERPAQNPDAPFLRVDGGEPWHLWADVPQIPAKGRARRIVLLGESVARGFFYDPHMNAAAVLRDALGRALRPASGGELEVIDLARVDLQMAALLNLARSSTALAPDALVIFAGNNWHPISGLNAGHLRDLANILRSSGSWRGVAEYLEARLRQQVRSALEELGRIRGEFGIPIVFVLPEFNLLDWRAESPLPVFPGDANLAGWVDLYEAAEKALEAGDVEKAAKLAEALLELDQGTAPAGFCLLARLRSEAGAERAQIRMMLEKARDAGMALTRHQPPRCYGAIQEVVRSEAAQHGIRVVDLPRVFEEHTQGQLPGRRLFHDYCHLTAEGMQAAMAATAGAALEALGIAAPPARQLAQSPNPISETALAEACFLAAIHNANWGNSPMVDHLLEQALRHSPAIAGTMRLYLDFHARRSPGPLCGAFAAFAREASAATLSLLFRSPRAEKTINFPLIQALARALARIEPEAGPKLDAMLKAEHGVQASPRNLLQKFYWRASWDQTWDQDRCAYYRATHRRSGFLFVCEALEPAEFCLTARVPACAPGGRLGIVVNGAAVHSFPAAARWRKEFFSVPAARLVEGINELEVVWPGIGDSGPSRMQAICAELEAGRIPEAGPVFGEIFTLTAGMSASKPQPALREAALEAVLSA